MDVDAMMDMTPIEVVLDMSPVPLPKPGEQITAYWDDGVREYAVVSADYRDNPDDARPGGGSYLIDIIARPVGGPKESRS